MGAAAGPHPPRKQPQGCVRTACRSIWTPSIKVRDAVSVSVSVWLASSTHEGEEEIVLKAHKALLKQHPDLCLLLAPRHPERGGTRLKQLDQGTPGSAGARRSKGVMPGTATQVYLADTLGEVGTWYALSPLVFLGGSLREIGGHNPFEPIQAGAAVITGTGHYNFAGNLRRADHPWRCGRNTLGRRIWPGRLPNGWIGARDPVPSRPRCCRAIHHPPVGSIGQDGGRPAGACCPRKGGQDGTRLTPTRWKSSRRTSNAACPASPPPSCGWCRCSASRSPLPPRAAACPAALPHLSIPQLIFMNRNGPAGARVWHARRNVEMLGRAGAEISAGQTAQTAVHLRLAASSLRLHQMADLKDGPGYRHFGQRRRLSRKTGSGGASRNQHRRVFPASRQSGIAPEAWACPKTPS